MENLNNDPIDEQITNDDNSVTNKDGDNMLEQEDGANVQDKPDEVRVPTVTPATEDAGTEDDKSKETEVDSSNTDEGPKGENL
jgi:hypothetical protein